MEYSEMKMDCEIIVPCAEPRFTEGQAVIYPAFTDHKGTRHDAVTGLTVKTIRLITPRGAACDLLNPYYRVAAYKSDGYQYIEGAERFFVAA